MNPEELRRTALEALDELLRRAALSNVPLQCPDLLLTTFDDAGHPCMTWRAELIELADGTWTIESIE